MIGNYIFYIKFRSNTKGGKEVLNALNLHTFFSDGTVLVPQHTYTRGTLPTL